MAYLKNNYVLAFSLLIIMLIDGQLSLFLSSFFTSQLVVSSHLFLLAFLYFFQDKSFAFSMTSALLLGLAFDAYYLGRPGFLLFLLPLLLIFVARSNKNFFASKVQSFLFYLIVLFAFEMAGYFLSQFLGFTNISLAWYVTYTFAPSLLYNLLAYALCHKWLKRLYFTA